MAELRCYYDVGAFVPETVDELEDLCQDLYHRLIEPPGSNIDDSDRGLGIEDLLSGPVDAALRSKIAKEIEKDERVAQASAAITEIETGSFRIDISVETDEDELGFSLESDASGAVRRVA